MSICLYFAGIFDITSDTEHIHIMCVEETNIAGTITAKKRNVILSNTEAMDAKEARIEYVRLIGSALRYPWYL